MSRVFTRAKTPSVASGFFRSASRSTPAATPGAPAETADLEEAVARARRFGHDFSRLPAGAGPRPPSLGPHPIQRKFMKDDGSDMTDQEVDLEVASHALTPPQISLIQQRKGHAKKYYLSKTIEALTSGTLQPPAPKPVGTSAMTRREAAGLINPSHKAPSVRPLFRSAAVSPPPSDRSEEDWLFSPSRRFEVHTPTHTHPPQIVQGHSSTVMGHGGPGREDAVDYWNRIGHTLPRQQNLIHNRQASIYHGLESKQRSAQSGGQTTSRYMSPGPTTGSHPSYYDSTHPGFNPAVPWTHYVPDQYGSMVPFMSATASSQTSTAPPQPQPPTQPPSPLPAVPPLSLPPPPLISQPPVVAQLPTAPPSTQQAPQLLPSVRSLFPDLFPTQSPSTQDDGMDTS